MVYKAMFYVWLVICSTLITHAYTENDKCGLEVDLRLVNVGFIFTDDGILLNWELRTPTDCPLQYRLTVNDEELGIIRDDYLEQTNATLDKLSFCITYNIDLTAINLAIPDVEGPHLTTTIRFSPKAQVAPLLGSLEAHSTSINLIFILEGNSNRCPLKNFYVDGGDYFNLTIPLQDLANRSRVPVQIRSLKPDSLYYFQVYVENSGGLSPANTLGVQTLHSGED